MSWQRSSSWLSYLLKRIARIVPAYICLTLIGVFVVGPLFASAGNVWSWRFISSRLPSTMVKLREVIVPGAFLHNPFPGAICGTVWTLSIEFSCYIGILFLGLAGALLRRWIPLVLFVFYLGLIVIPHPPFAHRPFNPTIAPLICYFLAGTVFHLYRDRIPARPCLAATAFVAVLASLIIPPILNLIWPLFGTYVVFWVAFQPYVTAHHFAKYGDFSYGLYLYGFPIQQIIVALCPWSRSPWVLFAMACPLSLIAGAVSWHLVEKHFLRKNSLRLKTRS